MSRTQRTVNERLSVTDAAIRPEPSGAAGCAGWQGRWCKGLVGLHGEGETLVPIPNTKVKPFIGYNTSGLARG